MVRENLSLERGDIVWIDFSPTKGREQSGLRPAVVISPLKYNSLTGLVLVCPLTTKSKKYFFEVAVLGPKGKSFVLVDQMRSMDVKERVKKQTGAISQNELSEMMARISVLFQ